MTASNLGQSYRERGMYNKALDAFYTGLNILADKSTKSIFDLHDIEGDDSRGVLAWSLSNTVAMHGLTSNWSGLEYAEKLLLSQCHTAIQRPYSESHANPVDPYTFSLMRFVSRNDDLTVNKLGCATLPAFEERNKERVKRSINQKKALLHAGYLSFDWRDHPMGRLTQKLVTHHNRSRIKSHSISYGYNDYSNVRRYVEINSPQFTDIYKVTNDKEAAWLINDLQIDILIDLTTHTYRGRIHIAASKPALLTINYLGYPGSTGCSGFDFAMVDAMVVPPESSHTLFSERLLYLPYTYQANYMPLEIPLAKYNANDGDTVILCSFNSNKKMEPISFSMWMNILRRSPHTILQLLIEPEDAKPNLLREAFAQGIAANRLHFIPRMDWKSHLLRAGASCDLILDTVVYGAHTTVTDMLWMSIPTITLESWGSNRMPSRVASSMIHSLANREACLQTDGKISFCRTRIAQIDMMVCGSLREYEETVIKFAKETSLRKRTRLSIGKLGLHQAIFDYLNMENRLEYAYQTAWEIYNNFNSNEYLKLHHIYLIKTKLLDPLEHWQTAIQQDYGSTDLTARRGINSRMHLSFGTTRCEQTTQCEGLTPEMIIEALRTGEIRDLLTCCFMQGFYREVVFNSCDALFMLIDESGLEQLLFDSISPLLFQEIALDHQQRHSSIQSIDEDIIDIIRRYYNGNIYSPMTQVSDIAFCTNLSMILKNHAVSLLTRSFKSESNIISLLLSAYFINPIGDRMLDIGLALKELFGTMYDDGGDIIVSIAVQAIHNDNFVSSKRQSSWHEKDVAGDDEKIVIYCYEYGNSWWPNWSPSKIEIGGVGGSEEAVIYISNSLAEEYGRHVEVYADPTGTDRGRVDRFQSGGSVSWFHFSEFDMSRVVYAFISWRYPINLHIGKNARNKLLWLHDLVKAQEFSLAFWDSTKVDAILVQGVFHRSHFLTGHRFNRHDSVSIIAMYNVTLFDRVIILPNGISEAAPCGKNFDIRNKNNSIFIYGSAPNRGLEIILREWGSIKAAIPDAILEVYYGFTAGVDARLGKTYGKIAYREWREMMIGLLSQDGIRYYGAVDHDTLMAAYTRAGFWLYPTTFQETGCISGMRAMVCGAIPITSKLSPSVLGISGDDLTRSYDFGPTNNPLDVSMASSADALTDWVKMFWTKSVAAARGRSDESLSSHREDMIRYSRETFSWRKSATKLEEIMAGLCAS